MKLSDWVGKLYGFDRMKQHKETHGAIPSRDTGYRGSEYLKKWTSFGGYSETRHYSEQIEVEGNEIHMFSDSILVIPEGKLELVPEKFHSKTIELPNSFNYAVIR